MTVIPDVFKCVSLIVTWLVHLEQTILPGELDTLLKTSFYYFLHYFNIFFSKLGLYDSRFLDYLLSIVQVS